MAIKTGIPPALAEISEGRDLITLRELACALNKSEQTLRKEHCVTGTAYGIRLHKIGGRLLASVSDAAALINGSQI